MIVLKAQLPKYVHLTEALSIKVDPLNSPPIFDRQTMHASVLNFYPVCTSHNSTGIYYSLRLESIRD